MSKVQAAPTPVWERLAALPALITVEETCHLLGLSRSACYRAVGAGHLPTVKMGRRLYVPTPALLSLLGVATPADRSAGARAGR